MRLELRPDEVAAVAMKEALASLPGRQGQMPLRFLYGSMLLSETMLVKDIGFPLTGVAEVSIAVDSRGAFQWKYCQDGDGHIAPNGDLYRRGIIPNKTHGIRSAACLPRGVKVYLGFKPVGTHACFGVGTGSVELSANGYCTLYGQDHNSWAIASTDNKLEALHAGKAFEFFRAGAKTIPVSGDDLTLPPINRIQVSF